MKKAFAIILILVLTLSLSQYALASTPSITLTGLNSSTKTFLGASFNLKGKVSANRGLITKISVVVSGWTEKDGIYSSKTIDNKTSYNLSSFEIDTSDKPFVEPGTYTIKIYVRTTETTEMVGSFKLTTVDAGQAILLFDSDAIKVLNIVLDGHVAMLFKTSFSDKKWRYYSLDGAVEGTNPANGPAVFKLKTLSSLNDHILDRYDKQLNITGTVYAQNLKDYFSNVVQRVSNYDVLKGNCATYIVEALLDNSTDYSRMKAAIGKVNNTTPNSPKKLYTGMLNY